MKEIYVGNLAYTVTEEDLRDEFSNYGSIEKLKLITDRDTGQSKGFAFIEYTRQDEAESAIKTANGKEFKGRQLKVNLSRAKDGGRTGGGAGRRSNGGAKAGGWGRW